MAVNNDWWVAEFVESLPSVVSSESELSEEVVGQFRALVFVYPYCKGGTGGVVVSCFADRAKRPIDLKGSIPLQRDLSNLRTSRRGRSYRR